MLSKDYATVEAVVDKGEPSRLLIEIALRAESLALPALASGSGDIEVI